MQSKAWKGWQEQVLVQLEKREAMRLCILRLRQGTQGRAFRAWYGEGQQRVALRATATKSIVRLQHLLLSRAFAGWAAFPAQQQELRQLAWYVSRHLASRRQILTGSGGFRPCHSLPRVSNLVQG
jgi:hypothetical protein